MTRLNTAAVATRYPDELKMLIEQYSSPITEEYLKNAKDVVKKIMPVWKRWEIIGDAVAEVMEPIEALALSPEEFEEKKRKKASFLCYVLKQPETVDVICRT